MPQPERNRIVISLDDEQPPARPPQQVQPLPAPGQKYAAPNFTTQPLAKPRSRVKKVLGVLLALILLGAVALGAGGFWYWRNLQSKPVYTLALLADAAQRGDTATFNQLVDVDKVTDNFVPQVTEKVNAQYGGVLTGPLKIIVDKLIPQFLPGVKAQVREQLNQKVKEAGADAKDYPFALLALGLNWKTSVTENGDTAQASLTIKDRPVELTLQKTGETWKVVGAKDDALADKIAQQVIKKIPAPNVENKDGGGILDQLPDEIRKRIPGSLGELKDQLPEGVKDKLPDGEQLKKEAEERIRKEIEERIKQNVPPELRDKLPLGGDNPKPQPKPSAKPPAPNKPPKPENNVEP
jgi:hypothetical protein